MKLDGIIALKCVFKSIIDMNNDQIFTNIINVEHYMYANVMFAIQNSICTQKRSIDGSPHTDAVICERTASYWL